MTHPKKGELWEIEHWTGFSNRRVDLLEKVLILDVNPIDQQTYGTTLDIFQCLKDDGTLINYPTWIFKTGKKIG